MTDQEYKKKRMKHRSRTNNDDFLKFNPKTGWINISELKDHGFSRKKAGMFLDNESVDNLIGLLEEYKKRHGDEIQR